MLATFSLAWIDFPKAFVVFFRIMHNVSVVCSYSTYRICKDNCDSESSLITQLVNIRPGGTAWLNRIGSIKVFKQGSCYSKQHYVVAHLVSAVFVCI